MLFYSIIYPSLKLISQEIGPSEFFYRIKNLIFAYLQHTYFKFYYVNEFNQLRWSGETIMKTGVKEKSKQIR